MRNCKRKTYNSSIKTYTIEQLRNKILYYINYRIRSEAEVRKKLQTLAATEEQISDLIYEFINIGLINDSKFIPFFIQKILEEKKYGLSRCRSELKFIGFSSELIEDALRNYFDYDEYSEEETALEVLYQKYKITNTPDSQKMIHFLIRRGFPYSTSTKAVYDFLNNDK